MSKSRDERLAEARAKAAKDAQDLRKLGEYNRNLDNSTKAVQQINNDLDKVTTQLAWEHTDID